MKRAPLRDLCMVKHGGTPSKANPAFWRGDIPWVSPKDMKTPWLDDAEDHISEAAVEQSATSVVPVGSVLTVVRSGVLVHTFPVAQTRRPVAFNQDIKAFVPDAELVEPDYLFWFVRAQGPLVVTRGVKKGATVHSVQSGFLENLTVPLPAVEEQRRIVDILSRADGIVRLRREAEKKAAELIPALFLEMFGNPVTNPKRWPMFSVGDVIDGAEYGTSTKASDGGGGLPMIRMGNVDFAGNLDLSDLKRVELSSEEVERYRLVKGDILFNRTNSKELVGKTGLWEGELDAVAASYFIRIRTDKTQVNPFFFWAFMNSRYMKKVLFDTARGAIGQSNINTKELKAFRIPVPPLPLQEWFELRCRDASKVRLKQATATAKAKAAFDALLAQTFEM